MNSGERLSTPHHIQAFFPDTHAQIVGLFFDREGNLIIDEDQLVLEKGCAAKIDFDAKTGDVRIMLEVKRGRIECLTLLHDS